VLKQETTALNMGK